MAKTTEKDKSKDTDTEQETDDSEDKVSDNADYSENDDDGDAVPETEDDAEDSEDSESSTDSADIDDNENNEESSDDASNEESDGDDSADFDDGGGEEDSGSPEEVATKSALIFDALSDASENYDEEDDTHIVQSGTKGMDADWSTLMDDFVKVSASSRDIQIKSNSLPALESLTLSSFGFASIKHDLDEEMKFMAKGYVGKLPSYLSGQVQNCLALASQGLSSVNSHIKTFQSRIDKKERIVTSFTWGVNSRQFMCAGVSLDTMPKLLAVANQQAIVHQHVAKEGCDHFIENATASPIS